MHNYTGRILQCDQGHAVCETCQTKLSECPTCQGKFLGTRNYSLEQFIACFKKMTNITTNSKNVGSEEVLTVGEPPTAKPIASMSGPSSALDSDEYEDQTSDNENLVSDDIDEVMSVDINAPAEKSRPTSPIMTHCQKASMLAPLQPKGIYACRMIGCNARLPVCRMLNHARYFHSDFLHTCKTTKECIFEEDPVVLLWTIPSRTSYRKIIQIAHFGLFFFIYNVRKQAGETTINSWVQCVRPNAKAREFHFKLNLKYGDAQVSYKDFVSVSAGCKYTLRRVY